jgi:kumamolisin
LRVQVIAAAMAALMLAGPATPVHVAGPATLAHAPGPAIGGPYAALLAASADLGPAVDGSTELTVALHGDRRPALLGGWAAGNGLALRWRDGDRWAVVSGAPAAMASAFGVDIRAYRHPRGESFHAATAQPAVPAALGAEVAGLGRILSHTPRREAGRWSLPAEVPDQGLRPDGLLRTYNIAPLREAGYTGRGTTVVVFAFDGFDQADLDAFTEMFDLPPLRPEVVGGLPSRRSGEATMDLQAIHAIAPGATKVLVNATPTVEGAGAYPKIAAMLEDTDRRYPGAVWSFSIGWGCDRLITAADLVPVRAALIAAQANGTTAFNASGDLAGLECKGGQEWSTPPSDVSVGLDAVASIPEMTSVGGTTLSTNDAGDWLAEQAWFDGPLSQGSAGGVSALYTRPAWQGRLEVAGDDGQSRLTPDIAAVADPFTGVRIVFGQRLLVGGGTSLAAPIWAGAAAVINQFLLDNGGRLIGDLNPLLYTIAEGTRLPAFRDVVLGGNAVAYAGPGYDMVTGLGTPNVENLARNILTTQQRLR